ncbi:MAG: hydrogenase 3 maturation endopeptidase HyCI, partial [Chloroflexi bacterium]|nr:hydrogenase 3 maturation endopeptidase HyCI [Chloroflexota bacterium]
MLIDELRDLLHGRIVVVGVGDEHRGDDAVGPTIAGMLAEAGVENVIDAGTSPEIETWRIREL